jgi:hypothetical protein
MYRRTLVAISVAGAVTLGLATGPGPSVAGSAMGRASSPGGCPTGAPAVPPASSADAGVWVAAHGRLVSPDGSAPRLVGGADQVVRHVVSVEGVGTAFIEDGRGADTVVVATAEGVVRLPQRAEALNPALSPSGDLAWSVGSQIRVRDADTGRIERLPVPAGGADAFSPVFVGGGALDVVMSAPPTPAVPEDEWRNEIWRVSPDRTWRRLTNFHAGDDRWTAVRTPVAAPEGGIEFILVRGRGSQTREPRFWLMHLGRTGLQRLRTLDHEMYLAGFDGAARLWNVPDVASLRVDLVREAPDGTTETIGCGTTLMDPIDVTDPDRSPASDGSGDSSGGGSSGGGSPGGGSAPVHAQPSTATAVSEIGILIGDFATSGEADAAAAIVRAAYGTGAPVRIVSADTAPHAVAPGAYGVLLALSAADDARSALAAFRARLPAYAGSSWLVTA